MDGQIDGQLTDEQFIELLTSTQLRLGAFALTLVRPRSDADDVLQNACMTLWKKRSTYDADREFFPWACGVVMLEVLKYRDKAMKEKLVFDDDLINTLSAQYVSRADELEQRRQILPYCIAKLNDIDRQLLEERYEADIKPKDISQQHDCPLQSVYTSLSRIRESLLRCIQRNLARQSHH